MKHILIIVVLTVVTSLTGVAQQKLTLEEAISISVENNFDIKLSENAVLKAENNQSVYNSGYLPTLNGAGGANFASNNTKLTSQSGALTEINGVGSTQFNGSLTLNYVLYNGGKRKYSYDKLKDQYELSTAEKQVQIENTLIDVYTTFFNVARNQEQILTLTDAYKLSKDRLDRAVAKQSYGQQTGLDVLNAKVDANADSIALLNVSMQLDNNVRSLNFLLGRDISIPFTVETAVNLDENLLYDDLLAKLQTNNSELKQMELNKAMSEQTLKINQAGWMPSVSTSAGYGTNYNNNGPAGFFAIQQSSGFNAGLSLSWDIFDGGTTKTNVQNAKIDIQNQELYFQKTKLYLENQLASFWKEYTTQKIIIRNEESNMEISNQNFLKSKELYNLGKITSLEYRQAQLNLINIKLNLLNATYNAKIAELQLKRFAGLLTN